jgi:hypothetical protein
MDDNENKIQGLMEARGYSIWLASSDELFDKLSTVIKRLSNRHLAPVFRPHVTLSGQIEAEEREIRLKMKQLIAEIKPFNICLGSLGQGGSYFQSLFLTIRPSRELLRINNLAKELFGITHNIYQPHISLMYGYFDEHKRREIGQDLLDVMALEGECLIMDRIIIHRTEGDVGRWREVVAFDLGDDIG